MHRRLTISRRRETNARCPMNDMPKPTIRNKSGPERIKTCEQCKMQFTTNESRVRFCSLSCSNRARGGMRTAAEKFLSKVSKSDGCWEWQGSRSRRGYGWFSSAAHTYNVPAHRASYELFCSEIPPGLYVLHKCDNPPCVRPDHLFIGTQRDNIHDMIQKGRHRYGVLNAK